MPIYEYRCTACGHQFEVSQRMSDAPLTECSVCQGELAKMLFAPAIHFKGTGFHNTDYGRRNRPAGEGESGSSDGGGKADAGGSANGDGAKKEPAAAPASSKKTVGLDKV